MPQSVLVTGATGFTGANLCRELVHQGHRVRALVRPTSDLMNLSSLDVEPVYGDLTQGDLPAECLRGVETVYHVAAVYRREGLSKHYFYDVNVGGTRRLLRSALLADVGRFVYTSTVGVLGDVSEPPATEQSPYKPHDHYQHSKMLAERMLLEDAREYNLPVVVVRPGAIYGPGDLRLLKLFRAIQNNVFWMIGNGNVYYHLVYIQDLIQGILRAGTHPEALGEVFIIAGDHPVRIRDLAHMIGDVLGKPVPERYIPRQAALFAARTVERVFSVLHREPPLYPRRLDFFLMNRYFDISKARSVLGYQPKYNLQEGLKRTVEWYRQEGYLPAPSFA